MTAFQHGILVLSVDFEAFETFPIHAACLSPRDRCGIRSLDYGQLCVGGLFFIISLKCKRSGMIYKLTQQQ